MMTEEQVKTLVETKVERLVNEKKREDLYKDFLDAGWPPALIKAINDPFEYYIKLKNGDNFYFREATEIDKQWVRLEVFNDVDGITDTPAKMLKECTAIAGKPPYHDVFPRGLEVRVSEIAYIADAPHGS